mgnify:CR=1 FL=1
MTPQEYAKLQAYTYRCASQYNFSQQDSEDILHDALLDQLESGLDIYKLIWKHIGKHRERRHREGKRQISLQHFEKKGEV